MSRLVLITVMVGMSAVMGHSQNVTRRPASPAGSAVTQIGGVFDARTGFVNGRWIEIRYGRPLKRGRDLFGTSDFVDFLNDGAPVWRAGANQSTRLTTEASIAIAGRTLAPGEYTLFIDLQPNDKWTLIVSRWPAQTTYDEANKAALWGAYQVHARPRRRAGPDARGAPAPRLRADVVGVPGRHRKGRPARAGLGPEARGGPIHRRRLTRVRLKADTTQLCDVVSGFSRTCRRTV